MSRRLQLFVILSLWSLSSSHRIPIVSTQTADEDKRSAIKETFLFAWKGYRQKAWGADELRPVNGEKFYWLDLGATIVDALDTLYIMDLKQEFVESRDWIMNQLNFDHDRSISFFETTIRILGGLLSAFELSKNQTLLHKADELGQKLILAFNNTSSFPNRYINLRTGFSYTDEFGLAEVGTNQLEFKYLAHYTRNQIYAQKSLKVYDVLANWPTLDGLYSVHLDPHSESFITMGGTGDSFYEYLLKYWILTSKNDTKIRTMYDKAMTGAVKYLIKHSTPSNLMYLSALRDNYTDPTMEHLACFAGALFALGAQGTTKQLHLEIGKGLTATCYQMYNRTATKLSPESVTFEEGEDFVVRAPYYILRPETVESFFVLWRLTHDPIYREWGWNVYLAIDKYCKTVFGYSGVRDVTDIPVSLDNMQQSFFLAETLKYLYLLFSEDELIPLDKYVFNTEAHPLGILTN